MSSSTTLIPTANSATTPSSSSVSPSVTSTAPPTSPATSDDVTTTTSPTSSHATASGPSSSILSITSASTSSSTSSIPITEPISSSAVSSSAITTQPTSITPTTTSRPSTLPSTSSQQPTSSSQPTSSDLSTSISASSTTSAGTVYSTKVVYVTGMDGNGSSYVSSTAISGGTIQNNTGTSGKGGNNIGAIVGGVVGGVVGLALLGAIAFFLWRKKRQPKAGVLDEKMFDPSRTARHSGGPNMPVDLVGDSFTGSGVSPYTSGMGSKAAAMGYGGSAALASAAGVGMGAYHHSRQPSDPRYPYPSRGSMDSTIYSGTTDPYLNNIAGMGAGAMAVNPAGRVQPGYYAGVGSSSGHETMPQSPNRMSGGWAVAAAMGNNDHDGGYTSRDYAGYPYPRGGMPAERDPYPDHPVTQQEPAGYMDESRMSAGALAKLREARGRPGYGSAGFSGQHGRRPSSQGLPSSQSYDGGDEYYRRNSGGDPRQSRTSEVAGDDRRESLVQHDDAGPFRGEEEEGHGLPAELPPTYNSVPRDARS